MTFSTDPGLRPSFLIFRDAADLDLSALGHEPLPSHWDVPDDQAWRELIGRLHEFRSLDADWDGQGADAPETILIDGAVQLATELRDQQATPADRVLAGVDGTISFEWIDQGYYVEIEVIEPRRAEIRSVDPADRSVRSGEISW